ncbi:MAG TPA: ATP phosphoribosyltransferase regulatory subunit [Ruminococcaceae bacterium]|jgi:ATP phosphoribosyltransferase regulatory subunit|nr:ATP phosphoribosyltransferase regulatory subunit [Oscillospiraceae bacterium]HCC03064.1 ATP phosphoribosyltransferase regulatory subunit [Oscillospiraceae bacterium]HCM24306.1 ATP phosphoribosyltransferase regulatory subunit [Oscillospiraceae bacterium]
MKKNNMITPEGTRDLLFEECLARRSVESKLADAFRTRGYNEVMTSGLEFYDVFDPKYSGINPEEMYKMSDRRGRILVMRPDSTMPIARLVATRLKNHQLPLRLFYTQPVYRSNPGLAGRLDENAQAGIEFMGASGIRADLEVLTTAVEALSSCAPDFRLELGHAGFFRELAHQMPVSEEQLEDIRSAIETKNYAALDTILDTLPQTAAVHGMRRLPRLFGGEEVFAQAREICSTEKAQKTLSYLHKIYHAVQDLGLGERVIVDLGMVQRNDYYTDIIFTAYTEGYGDSILMGGRYDNLLAQFHCPMPAIGFGINVDALTRIALAHGHYNAPSAAQILVFGENGYSIKALSHARALTKQGLRCETSVAQTRAEAEDYARSLGIRRLDVVGDQITEVLL